MEEVNFEKMIQVCNRLRGGSAVREIFVIDEETCKITNEEQEFKIFGKKIRVDSVKRKGILLNEKDFTKVIRDYNETAKKWFKTILRAREMLPYYVKCKRSDIARLIMNYVDATKEATWFIRRRV
jgi:hypothetical protein